MVKAYIRPTPYAIGRTAIPTHRDSVVSTKLTQANSRRASLSMAQQGHVMSAYNPELPLSSQRQPDPDNEGPVYNDWMSRFCVEPQHDVDTCCLGFWVPCALYGKTHWRVKRIMQDKDASNATWESNDGCNTPCWAWCGLAGCLGIPCAGIMTGIQRSHIRGTYGIKGNCASDMVLGICCPCCTQMQNDREVRAREGDLKMRYNPKYLKVAEEIPLVTRQPPPNQHMSYSAPQPEPDPTTGNNMQPGSSEQPNKLQKKTNPATVSKQDRHQSKAETQSCPTARELEVQRQARMKAFVQSAPKILVTEYQEETTGTEIGGAKSRKSSEKKVGIFGKFSSNKQQTIPEETGLEPVEPMSEQHTLVECDVVQVDDPDHNRKVQVTHTIVECTRVKSPPAERIESNRPEEHTIIECTTVQEEVLEAPASSDATQHFIEDCERVVEEISEAVTALEEHALDACDIVSVSEDDRPAQELSYVHDFTDCPVDKAILEYYEKEERKAKESELTRRIRTSLPTELLHVNRPISPHTLAECSDTELTPPSSPPNNQRSASYNMQRATRDPQGLRQHRLVSCPTPTVQSHHVAENALANSSEDSQATQKPIYNDKLHAEELNKSTDGVSSGSGSGSGETNSSGSNEDPANPNDDIVRRKHRRRYKKQRKAITQFPVISSDENKPASPLRSDSAHYSLEKVLAANGGKREKPQKINQVEKSGKQNGKNIDTSAPTTPSGKSQEGVRSEEDPKSPGIQHGISGLWSKLTTPTKTPREEKTEPEWA